MYSEKSKIPWSAIVVGAAVLVFGCIIVVSLVARSLLGSGSLSGGASPAPGVTEAAPAGSVAIDISSSNTKEDWMNAAVEQFNREGHKLSSGETVFVRVKHVTSGGSQRDILSGKSQPTVWSPGDQSWVDTANQTWRDRTGQPLVGEACPSTVLAPVGFALWRPMAEALGWPDKPISWDDLVTLSADPNGWATLGHPEWGQFKFGHTHPDYSNVGLLMMTALAYSTVDKIGGLTADEVYSDEVLQAFAGVEQNTYHYGIQNRPLMQLLGQRGPNYLHGVTSSEAEALKTNKEFASVMRFPLVFIFPAKGTFWSEHPYCILDADWVTEPQKEAARLFRDYLLDADRQAMAIDYYLRPIDESIPLHAPLSLEDGTDPRITRLSVPALESPSAEVAAAVKDVFHRTKKKATVLVLLDTSGSMEGDKIKAAVESSINFIKRLAPDDRIYVIGFGGDQPVELGQGGRAGDVSETLARRLSGLYADGNTPLHDAVCQAAERVAQLQSQDEAGGERRLYGIVRLSDGDDTSSEHTENQMFNCLPSGESVTGVKVFTIAFGEDANADLMLRIANRTNGKTFTGDPDSIESIYNAISAEQ
ncbi:MAG: VWA domain-containing protein [Chloroflexi bacterium]|nr:VWA domain-containing protein [Chloroflexota bacterium]